MRSIEEIVRTILNSDALMEKVNHVVEIERMKYNRGWSTETDIDNFSPIGFRKVVTSAMNLLGLPNESGEVDIASVCLTVNTSFLTQLLLLKMITVLSTTSHFVKNGLSEPLVL